MPHVIVKLYPGRSEEQKKQLADAIAGDLVRIAGSKEESISVAIEEVAPEDWVEQVYKPDILDRKETLYRPPGYNPLD